MTKLLYFDGNKRNMDSGNNKTATQMAAPGTAAGAPKEKIFSVIRKLEEEGISDGRRWLWARFADEPHVLVQRDCGGYVVLLWREGIIIRVTLDENLDVTGFDVETT